MEISAEGFAGLWGSLFELVKYQASLSRIILDYLHEISNVFFYIILTFAAIISLGYVILSLYALLHRTKNTVYSFDEKRAPFVTIQIPTRNEIIALRCAKKCLGFDYPKDRYEILIGDDSDDPEVSRGLAEFARQHARVHVHKRAKNVGFKPGNLNNMLKHTRGEIIVIFDSDFEPGKDFLRRIVAPFIHDPEIAAVQSRWKFSNANHNLVTALGATTVNIFHHVFLPVMKPFQTCFLCGSAEAVRKSYLVEYGGWQSGTLTEDIEYTLRLHARNKKIIYLPTLTCKNEAPVTVMDLCKQQMRWGYGVISAYKEHWKKVITARDVGLPKRMLSFLGVFGYFVPVFIMLLTVAGFLVFITHRPEQIDFMKFAVLTARNVSLTLGLIVASTVALYKAKQFRLFPRMIAASLSVGLLVTYFVNVGIYKALTNKPMQWFLLKKSKTDIRG
ncbi:MAG: glycosyltransferase [Candidatus Woesearchaeota archaeon]